MKGEYITIFAKLIRRTDGAILLASDDWDENKWVPNRALHLESRGPADEALIDDEVELRIEERFVMKNGMM